MIEGQNQRQTALNTGDDEFVEIKEEEPVKVKVVSRKKATVEAAAADPVATAAAPTPAPGDDAKPKVKRAVRAKPKAAPKTPDVPGAEGE